MPNTWFVRAGSENRAAEDFLRHKILAVGWCELGKFEPDISKAELIQLYQRVFPDRAERRAQIAASQIVRFFQEFQVGDAVITYDPDTRVYYLGEITSDYQWNPDLVAGLPRIRNVDWKHAISRDVLSDDAKNTLASRQTLILVRAEVAAEVKGKARAL